MLSFFKILWNIFSIILILFLKILALIFILPLHLLSMLIDWLGSWLITFCRIIAGFLTFGLLASFILNDPFETKLIIFTLISIAILFGFPYGLTFLAGGIPYFIADGLWDFVKYFSLRSWSS